MGTYILLLVLWASLTIEQTGNLFHPFIDIEAQVDEDKDKDKEDKDDRK